MALRLDELQAEVERVRATQDTAVALLGQLAQMLIESADDPVKVTALAQALRQSNDVLTAAIAGVPEQPADPVEPPPAQ